MRANMPIFFIGKINANVMCGHGESTFMAREKKQLGLILQIFIKKINPFQEAEDKL